MKVGEQVMKYEKTVIYYGYLRMIWQFYVQL